MTIEELEKQLKNEELKSIYVFYGEEVFLMENAIKKIKKKFDELILGINFVVIDEENISTIISNIETPAFGYEKKLIIIKNTGLLKKEGKRKNVKLAESKEKLENYIKQNMEIISKTVVLVFIEEVVEKNSFYKMLEKNAIICNFEKQKIVQIIKRLKAICMAYNVKVSEENLKYLLECSGTNMQSLINEIRKLIEYTRREWGNY